MRKMTAVFVLLAALWLGGCASLEPTERHAFEVRSDYVAAVERTAQQRGVDVIWLNPPTQRRSRQIEWRREITVERGESPDS